MKKKKEKLCEKVIYCNHRCSYTNRIRFLRGPRVYLKTEIVVEEKQTFSIWMGLKSQSMSVKYKITILGENKSYSNED